MTDVIKILSLDGGGIRGIISAIILDEIESLTQTPISQLFHLIAGTSTGGIITLALTVPNEQGNPRYSTQDVIALYEKEGHNIFPRSFLKDIESLGGVIDERYASDGIEDVLERYLGNTRLQEALTNVLITSYEVERRFPFFFSSRDARNPRKPNYDFFMKHIARATSAAPTYFEPMKIETCNLGEYYVLIDGGTYANNPALCALVEAQQIYLEFKDFLVVSVGTGQIGENTQPLLYDRVRNWGKIEWLPSLLNVVFDGINKTVDFQLQQLLTDDCYYRFQPILQSGNDAIDNTNITNIEALEELACQLIHEKQDIFKKLCEQLTR